MAWTPWLYLTVLPMLIWATPPQASDSEYQLDISSDGNAQLRRVDGTAAAPIWTVTCAAVWTGCQARSFGQELSLILDSSGRAWIVFDTGVESRVFLQRSNLTQPRSDLNNQPLSPGAIADLSHADAQLWIEENGLIVLHSPTAGLAHVVNYLGWLHAGGAVGTGDARFWPGRADLTALPQDIPALDPLRESAEKSRALPSFIPPFTKPQVEFAIRSQSPDQRSDQSGP